MGHELHDFLLHILDGKSKIKEQLPKSAIVLWNDAEICPYIYSKVRAPLEYTVEISPPTEAPLKNFLYHIILSCI